jgi:acyl-CoA synthetase (AMP-forming)/AMP-acid ligase II
MLTCHRFLDSLKSRMPSALSSSNCGFIARDGSIKRTFTITPLIDTGNLADVCNNNVVLSPFPPIMSSDLAGVPQFVSSCWGDPLSDKVAIRDGSTGETRTFSDYRNRMNRISSALANEYHLKPDETVALFSPNNVDYLPICLGAGICGAKITPVNPLSTSSELSKILALSSSKILFTHARLLPVALDAVRSAPCVGDIVVIPDVQSDTKIPSGSEHLERLTTYETSNKSHFHANDRKCHPWLLPYSSGTTGLPKGVMLSHANIIMNLLQLDEVEKTVLPQDHKLISPLPFFHIYGMLVSLLYCAWRGQELITMSERFDLEWFCQLVQEHQPHRAHLVPPVSGLDNYRNFLSSKLDGALISLQTILVN